MIIEEEIKDPKVVDKVRMPNNNKYSPAEEDKKHKTKEELFKSNPEEFIHINDIVVAALKSEHGIGVMIGKCTRQDMELASVRVSYRVFSLFQQMEIQQMMQAEKEKKIVTAPGTPTTAGGIIT